MLHKFKKKEQELNERKKQLLQNKAEIEKLIQVNELLCQMIAGQHGNREV